MQNLSQNGLERIAKMQNLSQNEIEQIINIQNLSRNELEQIAKMERIKDYKNMSKERLIIALFKSAQPSRTPSRSNSDNAELEKTRKIFDGLRDKFAGPKIKKNQKKALQNRRKKNLFRSEEKKS